MADPAPVDDEGGELSLALHYDPKCPEDLLMREVRLLVEAAYAGRRARHVVRHDGFEGAVTADP